MTWVVGLALALFLAAGYGLLWWLVRRSDDLGRLAHQQGRRMARPRRQAELVVALGAVFVVATLAAVRWWPDGAWPRPAAEAAETGAGVPAAWSRPELDYLRRIAGASERQATAAEMLEQAIALGCASVMRP